MKHIVVLLSLTILMQMNFVRTADPYTDFESDSFKRVMATVVAQHPEVANWHPLKATRQTVSGFIYRFRLTSDKGESVSVTALEDARSSIIVLSFTTTVGRLNFPSKTTGKSTAYVPFTDFSNSSFHTALAQATWQNYGLLVNNRLIMTDLFVSDYFYYFKFTFSNRKTGALLELIECISFETPAVPIPMPNVMGGFVYMDENKPQTYYYPYSELIDFDPSYTLYKVMTVMTTRSGSPTYDFVLEKSLNGFERRSFSLWGNGTPNRYVVATYDLRDSSLGYSQKVIQQVKMLAFVVWGSDLNGFTFFDVTSIRKDKTGLRLIYKNYQNGSVKYVELDLQDNDETFIIYTL